jgi:hypothetical protein
MIKGTRPFLQALARMIHERCCDVLRRSSFVKRQPVHELIHCLRN